MNEEPQRVLPVPDYEPPRYRWPAEVSGSRRFLFSLGLALVCGAIGYGIGTREREAVAFWAGAGGMMIGATVPLRLPR